MRFFGFNQLGPWTSRLLMTFLIAVVILGCGTGSDNVIKIGALLPLTGDAAQYGQFAKNGIELAVTEANRAGGINGSTIQIVYEDTQADPTTGVAAARKLLSFDEVNCVIGGLASSVTLAIAPIMNERKVVLLSPASSAPRITDAGDYIFRNCASDDFEGKVLAEYAFGTLAFEEIAILSINNDYGLGIRSVFKETFESLGGKVIFDESFEQGETDYRSLLGKVKATNPKGIVIVGHKELAQLLRQAKETSTQAQFLSTVMIEDPQIIELSGGAAEGVVYSARTYNPEEGSGPTGDFVKDFSATYGSVPDIFAALGYDAAMLLVRALKGGAVSADDIKQVLYSTEDYGGAAGTISFDENGDVVQPAVMKTITGGQFELLEQ